MAEAKKIYRYLPKEFADRFFETGSIQISSLARCRSFEASDVRSDPSEGYFRSTFYGVAGRSSPKTFHQFAPAGTMLLCSSARYSRDLLKRFGVDACIEIFDVESFFDSISECLKSRVKFSKREMGRVQYLKSREQKIHYVRDDLLDIPPVAIPRMLAKVQRLVVEGETLDSELFEKLGREANGFADELLQCVRHDAVFCKPIKPFQVETEFRMLWYCSEVLSDRLILECPDSVKFCRKYIC